MGKDLKAKYINHVALAFLLVWIFLALTSVTHLLTAEYVRDLSSIIELFVHAATVLLIFHIYKKLSLSIDQKIFRWFIISYIFLLLTDVSWWVLIYIFSETRDTLWDLSFSIPYFICLPAAVIFFSKILTSHMIKIRNFFKIFSFFVLINIIIMTIFVLSAKWKIDIFSYNGLYQISTAGIELIIFDLAILCLMCAESNGALYFLSGYIIIVSGDFWIKYCFISQTFDMLVYGELFWFLGLMSIIYGLFIITRDQDYEIKKWFRSADAIKSRLIFWTFGVSVISFITVFMLVYIFSSVSHDIFIWLPFFVMIYSVFVVYLSFFIGKQLEQPFKKLENNIKIYLNNKNKNELSFDFSISEFIFLNQFFINSIKAVDDKNLAEKKLATVATQVAHDIRSPLAAINMIIKKLGHIPEKQKTVIHNASQRINDIANNLLTLYKSDSEVNNEKNISNEFIFVLIDRVISEKREHFSNRKISFEIVIHDATDVVFCRINANEFCGVISNIIDNAVEAIVDNGAILVHIEKSGSLFSVKIKDNGCGMSDTTIMEVMNKGVSVGKSNGTGIGLISSIALIKSWGGSLSIDSAIGIGTTITITLPISIQPDWFLSHLDLHDQDTIVIVDDDQSIHDIWNTRLLEERTFLRLNIIHFYHPSTLIDEIKNVTSNALFLIDFEFNNSNLTGVDLIEKLYRFEKSILVTSHYENKQLRTFCESNGIKIIPKNYAIHLPIFFNRRAQG